MVIILYCLARVYCTYCIHAGTSLGIVLHTCKSIARPEYCIQAGILIGNIPRPEYFIHVGILLGQSTAYLQEYCKARVLHRSRNITRPEYCIHAGILLGQSTVYKQEY